MSEDSAKASRAAGTGSKTPASGTSRDAIASELFGEALEQLALSEARYRSLVRASSELVWIASPDGIEPREAPEWREFTGQTPDDLKALGWIDAIHPEDREHTLTQWKEAVDSGGPYNVVHRVRRRDGVYRVMKARAVPVRDGSNGIVEWVGMHTDITEQKELEAALQLEQSKSTFMRTVVAAVERAQDVVMITEAEPIDPPGPRIVYVNAAFEKLTGYAPQEILGQSPRILQGPGSDRAALKRIRDSLKAWQPVREEVVNYRKDGSEFYVELSIFPIVDERGWFTHWISFQRDTTEQHQVRQELAESESQFRLGTQVAKLALAQIDYGTGINHLSAEAARLFGLGETAISVARAIVHATFHPQDQEELARRIAMCLDPSGPGWFEKDHRVVWPSGEVRWLRVRKQVYFEGEGASRRPERATLAAFDVTEEKNATDELRESERSFRALAESLPQMVWACDGQGVKSYCNQRYFDYTGLTSVAAVNTAWSELLHEDDRESTVRQWNLSVKTGLPYMSEYRMRRHDGEFRWFLANAVPSRNEAGQVERWIGSCTDVHDRKLAEEALRKTEKLAVTGRLAASMAHEINNPLTSVINLLYLLSGNRSLDRAAREYVQTAQEELARVSEITTQTLRFHKQSTAPAPTRIPEVLDSILTLYKGRLKAAEVQLQREYERTDPIVCLAGEVRQAIANVIGNAVDATPPEGKLRIRLRHDRDWKARQYRGIRITIADNGPGMDKRTKERIFEPFFSTKGITGTGLGLWITKSLVEKHQGSISVRTSTSSGRTGTAFSIFLPFEFGAEKT